MICNIGGTLRTTYLSKWKEYVIFDEKDMKNGQVIATGQLSGNHYVLTISDSIHAELRN